MAIFRWMAPVSDKTSLKKNPIKQNQQLLDQLHQSTSAFSTTKKKRVVSSIVPGLSARWRGNVLKAAATEPGLG